MLQTVLGSLFERSCTVRGDLAGVPGVMRTAASWDTGPTLLEEHLCYYVLRGEALAEAAGRTWTLMANSLIVCPPHTSFRVRAGGRPPHVLRCRFVIAQGSTVLSCWSAPVVVEAAQAVLPLLQGLVDELVSPRPPSEHEARVRAFLVLLLTGCARPAQARDEAGRLGTAQQRLLTALIDQDEELRLTPRDLARHVGLSLDYFTRCFRRTWGEAPRTYLVRSRILAASRRLAQGGASIQDIARSCGCADVNLFARQFRLIIGTTPSRWRAQRGRYGPV